ncbi:MAG: MobF family relaxase [Pseudomonadota bacterium]
MTVSVASVSSASGAAGYFAADNYYLGEGPGGVSEWGGKGAKEAGLSGKVTREDFENVLDGKLPDGTIVNASPNRQVGLDVTHSLPKSASILALVTGDKRILDAHFAAVRQAMAMTEKDFAEARDYSRVRKGEPVQTGNFVYALFQHDTSRKLDPQAHIHVVIASITQRDGKWMALRNGALWQNNTVMGSRYHAFARAELEKIGYETTITGKHGQFEIAGVPKEVLKEFSQRREEIVAKASELGISTPQGQDSVVINTRDPKLNVDDKEALRASWKERALARGFDGQELVDAAIARVAEREKEAPLGSPRAVQQALAGLRDLLSDYLRPSDPLTTRGFARVGLTPSELRTEMAVASAVRILGQREAAFDVDQLGKRALDIGLKGVTPEKVEARVSALMQRGDLIPGISERTDGRVSMLTTPEHLAQERALLSEVDAGRGAVEAVVPASDAAERLQEAARERPLNGEQLGAATLALSTSDRVVVVQGVAGAGKTTMVKAMAEVAQQEGKEVLGLAFANTMVAMLREEAGINTQTVSSFVNEHIRDARKGKGETLAGKVLVLDEASLVANEPMTNLVSIANRLGADRLIMIGDRAQLQPIDAGKAFSLVQRHKPEIARMETSLRQRTEHMQQVATLTREGKFAEAFEVLGERVEQVKAGEDHVARAAEKWLALGPEDRAATALYASGRASRAELNDIVQAGLKDEGKLGGEARAVSTLARAHATREELRMSQTYEEGQIMEVMAPRGAAGLERGRYDVLGHDAKGRVLVRDEDGRTITFDPSQLDPKDNRDAIELARREEIKLHEGEQVRWSANDKARGLLNSESATVLGVDEHGIRIENTRGEIHTLANDDPMLERLGLAYAINMHQAQGMTTDKGIGVMRSSERRLSNQRLTHVMATRVRDDITIMTNDRERLLSAIQRNPGDKTSALEATGEKAIDREVRAGTNEQFRPKIPEALKPDRSDSDRTGAVSQESLRAPEPQIDAPERQLERGR